MEQELYSSLILNKTLRCRQSNGILNPGLDLDPDPNSCTTGPTRSFNIYIYIYIYSQGAIYPLSTNGYMSNGITYCFRQSNISIGSKGIVLFVLFFFNFPSGLHVSENHHSHLSCSFFCCIQMVYLRLRHD